MSMEEVKKMKLCFQYGIGKKPPDLHHLFCYCIQNRLSRRRWVSSLSLFRVNRNTEVKNIVTIVNVGFQRQ